MLAIHAGAIQGEIPMSPSGINQLWDSFDWLRVAESSPRENSSICRTTAPVLREGLMKYLSSSVTLLFDVHPKTTRKRMKKKRVDKQDEDNKSLK